MNKDYEIFSLGDHSLTLQSGNRPDLAVNRRMVALAAWLREQIPEGLLDVIPSYNAVTVVYDVYRLRKSGHPGAAAFIHGWLKKGWEEEALPVSEQPALVELPVCYEPPYCSDKEELEAKTGLTWEEIIALHTGQTYQVCMIGFMPGFPYMGVLPEALRLPRKESPKADVPAGSVAIAAEQTGIYPVASPGGWWILGRTPVPLFDAASEKLSYFSVGDEVKFLPVSLEEYERISKNYRVI